MRRQSRFASAVCSIVPLLLALAANAARADEFSDFRIPDHRIISASGNVSGSFFRTASSREPGSSRRDARSIGDLAGFASWMRESERGVTALSGGARFGGDRAYGNTFDESFTGSPIAVHSVQTSAEDRKGIREAISLDGTWRRYPWGSPLGIECSGSGYVARDQQWGHGNRGSLAEDSSRSYSSRQTDESELRLRTFNFSGRFSLGYGRVRDATGVYSARILVQRLRDAGVLNHTLSETGAGKLAALFYVQRDFSNAHDRPDKYFWAEVEKILQEEGALSGRGFDAYAVHRVLEPMTAKSFGPLRGAGGFYRQTGYFAGLAATGYHYRYATKSAMHSRYVDVSDTFPPFISDYSATSTTDFEEDLVLAGPAAEFHRPIGLRWQLDASTRLGMAFQNARVESGLDWISQAAAVFAISDRWYWSAQASHARVYTEPTRNRVTLGTDYWHVTVGSGLGYFLEDQVALSLGLVERQGRTRDSYSFPSGSRVYSSNLSAQFGVTYRFLGSLEAPGLISPVRRIVGGR